MASEDKEDAKVDDEIENTSSEDKENAVDALDYSKTSISYKPTITLKDIIVALHAKALDEVKSEADVVVKNSMIDGEGKNAKFYGAGNHLVVAIPKDKDTKLLKSKALAVLSKYIQWFVGPDIKVTKDDLYELEDDNETNIQTTKKETKHDVDSDEEPNESIKIPSFADFLLLEDGEETAVGNATETVSDASGETGAENDVANAQSEENSTKASEKDGESSSGYYISYQVDIKGQPSHPLKDALKKMGTDLLKGFGVSVGSWRSGSSGEVKTLGDLTNALADVFGSIDPGELETNLQHELRSEFRDSQSDVKVIDTKTILSHLSKFIPSNDKAKIKPVEMAVTVKVNKNDKSYKLFNKQAIADMVTKSISGIVKKFKNKIDAKDVVLVNNYSDNAREKNKFNSDKEEGTVADSLTIRSYGQHLYEDAEETGENVEPKKIPEQKERIEAVKSKLDSLAKAALKDALVLADAKPTEEVIQLLKDNGIDEPKFFNNLQTKKYSFVIQTKTAEKIEKSDTNDTKTEVNSSLKANSRWNLLKTLFEAVESTDETTKKTVQKILTDLIYSFKKEYLPDDAQFSENAIEDLVGYEAEDSDEENVEDVSLSLKKSFEMLSQLFEDMDFNDYDYVFEAGAHTAAHVKQIIDRVGAENIIANKDKIIAAGKEAYGGKDEDSKRIKAKLLGSKEKKVKTTDSKGKKVERTIPAKSGIFDDFFKLSTSDAMKKFVDDKFGNVEKDSDEERIVQGFWKCLDLAKLPDKNFDEEKSEPDHPKSEPDLPEIKKITIKFFDYDPSNPDDEDPAVVKEEDIDKGGSVTPPSPPKHEGFDFVGWKPDDFDNIEEPRVYVSQYQGVKTEQLPVTFLDMNFEEGSTEEIKTEWVEKGKSATPPSDPHHDGYKFTGWSGNLDNIQEPTTVIAEYEEIHKITFVQPDPEDPEDDTKEKPIGEPQEVTKPEDLEYPEPLEIDEYEFEKWDPDEDTIKTNGLKDIDKIRAIYKKKDGENSEADEETKKRTVFWVIPDENGLLDDDKDNKDGTMKDVNFKHTDLDFYIVPMKGLKDKKRYNNQTGKTEDAR